MRYFLLLIIFGSALISNAQSIIDIQYQYTPKGELKFITENGITLNNYYDASGNRITTSQVSVEEIANKNLSLVKCYPNPTQAWVTVEMKIEKPSMLILFVVNHAGQTLEKIDLGFTSHNQKRTVDFHQYASGVYFINVFIDGENHTTKVIKF
jgi:hypothetical protein